MKIENREYRMRDFFVIPLFVSPGMVVLRVIDKIIYALIPSLQVLVTASFIDTAIGIFNRQTDKSRIMLPLLLILLLISHQYITSSLIGLVKAKMNINLTEVFRTAVTEKRPSSSFCGV
jgi:ATP-binding cassette subfamily B protein